VTPGYGAVTYTYSIGKYEVTAGQYCEFLNQVARSDTFGLYVPNMWSSPYGCGIQQIGSSGSYTYSVAPDYVNRPANYVTWASAARFANWLHNGQPTGAQDASTTENGSYYLDGATSDEALLAVTRRGGATWAIPTEDEWYKAAYHKNDGMTGSYWDYPTSSNSVPGRDMNDASGNNANYGMVPFPIDSPYYTTPVGEFQNSQSPYGTFDQGGNVWEWNEAVRGTSGRNLRGGGFNAPTLALPAEYDGLANKPTILSPHGFRMVMIPEPTTLAIATFGGIAMLLRRKGLG
jgi:formylglycine-generating enzyme required for sulfatase activity